MKSDFLIALTQLAAERNLPRDKVIEAVEAALVSAYKKDNGANQNVAVKLKPESGEVSVYQLKTVVEEVTDPAKEMTLAEAKKSKLKENPQIGDILEFELPAAQAAGRIAAQTAKQVVIQRLREAERELVFNEFAERKGEVLTATVQRGDPRHNSPVTLDLNGRAEATLPPQEQAPYERYRPGQRAKVLILDVRKTNRGPEIIVSRSHPDLLRRLFEMEVPEIFSGAVEIKAIAREAGSRSKVAVVAKQEGIDPVGACVGLRGIRIQNIVNELQGEKIDVIQWSKDPAVFIAHALSPAQPMRVEMDEKSATAMVVVPDRQLSLAIGREGQNARLAAKLTNWKVDIKSSSEIEIERMKRAIETQVAEQAAAKAAPPAVVEQPKVAEAAPAAPVAKPEPEPAVLQPVAQQPAAPVEDGRRLSIEEQLALESLEMAEAAATRRPAAVPAQPVVEEEEGEEVEVEEDVWKVPETVGSGPQIRFAEDILGRPTRGGGGGKKKRRGGRRGGRGGDDEPE